MDWAASRQGYLFLSLFPNHALSARPQQLAISAAQGRRPMVLSSPISFQKTLTLLSQYLQFYC